MIWSNSEVPFRWDITRRSQLGTLIEGALPPTYGGFVDDLQQCGARVIGLCDDGDLFFVGRSPESLFDHLDGLLFDSSWARRLCLVQFSAAGLGSDPPATASALTAFRAYGLTIGLAPEQIAHRPRPVTFVDLVSSGHTLEHLVRLLYTWCGEHGHEWSAVPRKLRIVGITWRTKTSPHTERWQQHADWVGLLERGAIKNVSAPGRLWGYLGNTQPKVTPSYPHWRWGLTEATTPTEKSRNPEALRLAVHLFDEGRTEGQRRAFARHLARDRAMIYPWYRDLMREVKG